jgi:hypothetical protein
VGWEVFVVTRICCRSTNKEISKVEASAQACGAKSLVMLETGIGMSTVILILGWNTSLGKRDGVQAKG